MLGAPMLGGDLHATYDDAAYSAAEAYTDLFLGYVTAEGLASHHVNVVIGESVECISAHEPGRRVRGDVVIRWIEGFRIVLFNTEGLNACG